MEKEHQRFRAALEKIVTYEVTPSTPHDEICHVNAPVCVAQEALKGE